MTVSRRSSPPLIAVTAGSARPTPAADAHALGEAFARAVASGNVDAVLDLYADDARVIYPGQGQARQDGAASHAGASSRACESS
jgi:ketosteroid isomerase-like protein